MLVQTTSPHHNPMKVAPHDQFAPLALHPTSSVFVLTGAGISAESGIRTFRDAGGLWEEHRIEDVATPEGFLRNPPLVWRFYSERRLQAAQGGPNPPQRALPPPGDFLGDDLFVCPQKVD